MFFTHISLIHKTSSNKRLSLLYLAFLYSPRINFQIIFDRLHHNITLRIRQLKIMFHVQLLKPTDLSNDTVDVNTWFKPSITLVILNGRAKKSKEIHLTTVQCLLSVHLMIFAKRCVFYMKTHTYIFNIFVVLMAYWGNVSCIKRLNTYLWYQSTDYG